MSSDNPQPGATKKSLTPEQKRAIEALLTHASKSAAAKAANVHRSTLYRWLTEDAEFQRSLEDASEQALKEFSQSLTRLTEKAIIVLDNAMDNDKRTDYRLRAAHIVVSSVLRVRELVDLEERLAKLEAQYGRKDD